MVPEITVPETKYALLGEDRIAYQVFGEGEIDLLYVPASGDGMETRWYWPPYAEFLYRLGQKVRVISFDRRGTGGSDPPSGETLSHWELWADDARAVLDAAGSERAVILGGADSGPIAILFSTSHPARTLGLILITTAARWAAGPDYPAGLSEETLAAAAEFVSDAWGTEAMAEFAAPELASQDPDFRRWYAQTNRLFMSPKQARDIFTFQLSLDVREALPLIQVPTLILHAEDYGPIPVSNSHYLANHISGARLALFPGTDTFYPIQPLADLIIGHIEEFVDGLVVSAEPDRALASVLFTDIVGSTAKASSLGDREWRRLLETHDAVAQTIVGQHRGRVVKTTGDGILATFDGPGRAIRCAISLRDALQPLGLQIRAGLHTGEVEVLGTDIAGIGVHIAARILDAASPGDLVVSPAVPILVTGSGIEFEDRGEHELKGVPGTWKLFAVRG